MPATSGAVRSAVTTLAKPGRSATPEIRQSYSATERDIEIAGSAHQRVGDLIDRELRATTPAPSAVGAASAHCSTAGSPGEATAVNAAAAPARRAAASGPSVPAAPPALGLRT